MSLQQVLEALKILEGRIYSIGKNKNQRNRITEEFNDFRKYIEKSGENVGEAKRKYMQLQKVTCMCVNDTHNAHELFDFFEEDLKEIRDDANEQNIRPNNGRIISCQIYRRKLIGIA